MFHVEQPVVTQPIVAVPRGTDERLALYRGMLVEWQQRMNLVGPSTLAEVDKRHFGDSLQLADHVPAGQRWLDIGAGAGFPGLVLAAADHGHFLLVDSIAKKCRFLEAVRDALEIGDRVVVHCGRVEAMAPQAADVVTARATASLRRLLEWSLPHLARDGLCLFPKGRNWQAEVDEAARHFRFDLDPRPSRTDPDARILLLHHPRRRG